MVEVWIAIVGIVVVAIAAYLLGYNANNQKWMNETTERVNQLVSEKINEVGQLYDESYRNVLKHLFEIVDEVERKDDSE